MATRAAGPNRDDLIIDSPGTPSLRMQLKHDRDGPSTGFARADMRGELTDIKPGEITFVEHDLTTATHSVSVDLKSALEASWQHRFQRLDAVLDAELGDRASLEGAHLRALVQAGRELAGNGALDKLFELILDLSLGAVKALRGVVMTLERQRELKCRAIRGDGLRISGAVRDLVMNEGRSLLIRDARLDQDFGSRAAVLSQEIRSILAVPLQTDERVIGLLYLDSPHLVREFTPEDLNLVTVMANIAAIRIEHARLTEQEQASKLLAHDLERAAEIQRQLLPSNAPEIPGFDVAGYNAPCRTVGGDYFDFLRYQDGRVALLIGDVSGKGLAAALLMSSLQARAHVLFEDPEPLSAHLCRLNRSVTEKCPANCFITFFVGVLDPANGEFVYCNAGHNAPLLLRSNDEFETLWSTGVPLGIIRNFSYEQKSCRLGPGDVLVLYSDGVTETCASNNDEEFGEQHLLAVMRSNRNHPASAVLEAIKSELFSFTQGAPAADDITLVVVQRCQL